VGCGGAMADSMYSPTAMPSTTMLSTSSEPAKRWRPLALNAPEEANGPVFCVRNTFIDTVEQLSPSLLPFYQERRMRTCPATHVGRLRSHLENRFAGAEELQLPSPDEAGALPPWPLQRGPSASVAARATSGSSPCLGDAVSEYCTPRSASCMSPAFSAAEASTEWLSPCRSQSSTGTYVRLETMDSMPTLLVSAQSPARAAYAETHRFSKPHDVAALPSIGSAGHGKRRKHPSQKARTTQKARRAAAA